MVQVKAHIHGRLSLTKEAPISPHNNLNRIGIQYPSYYYGLFNVYAEAHTHTHTCTHARACTHAHAHAHAHTHTHTHTYKQTNTNTHTYVRMHYYYVCTQIYMGVSSEYVSLHLCVEERIRINIYLNVKDRESGPHV